MFVKALSFCIFVIVSVSFEGSDGVPRPCPQFLPVAVRLDSPRTPYHLKTSVKVKDDKENLIYEDSDKLLSDLYPTDLLLPEVKDKPIIPPIEPEHHKETTERATNETKLLTLSEIPNENSKLTERPIRQRQKKRRRSRPKEARKIILSQNSNWALKTINDKPAAEVLMTDKASVARDLKDATESALVAVRKLDEINY